VIAFLDAIALIDVVEMAAAASTSS